MTKIVKCLLKVVGFVGVAGAETTLPRVTVTRRFS